MTIDKAKLRALALAARAAHGIWVDHGGNFRDPPALEAFDKGFGPDEALALLDELDDAWAATDRAGWVALKEKLAALEFNQTKGWRAQLAQWQSEDADSLRTQLAIARKALDQNLRDAAQVLVLVKGVFIRLRMTQIIGTAREALAAIAKEQTP